LRELWRLLFMGIRSKTLKKIIRIWPLRKKIWHQYFPSTTNNLRRNKEPQSKKRKFRLLLDSAFAGPQAFPKLRKKANIAHAVLDFGLSRQAEDKDIYQKAIEEKRLVLTINFKHFQKLVQKGKSGIIGIESQLTNKDIDRLVTEFLTGKDPEDYRGKAIKISS